MPSDPLLVAHGVVKRFGGLVAVDGVDVEARRGELVGLIGPNGAGKTTLFHCIAGFHKPDAGAVLLAGVDVTGSPPHEMAGRGLARTFQLVRPIARLTVLENVMLAAAGQTGERMLPAMLRPGATRREERDVAQRARAELGSVGLEAMAGELAGNLSGGQKKLLELARCFMLEPKVVLLDEPMAGVDPVRRKEIMEAVQRARRDRGAAFLMVEHDMETVMGHCDRVVVMAKGRKIAEGPAEEVRRDPKVVEAYLGG